MCCQKARDRTRWSKRRNARLKGDDLERYRLDPNREQLRGDDFIICRICGGPFHTLYSHLSDVHGLTSAEYRKTWPGTPIADAAVRADRRERSKRRRAAVAEDPKKCQEILAKARAYQKEYRSTHVEELRRKRRENRAVNRDAIKERKRRWRIAHRDEINKGQRERYAANREKRNARQRETRAADPERFREYGRKNYAKHRPQHLEYAANRRKAAWRPADWDLRSIEFRIIGTELLAANGYISNRELGKRLDTSRLLICPYGPSWEKVLSSDKAEKHKRAFNFISEVRKWVRRPGKSPGTKSPSIL